LVTGEQRVKLGWKLMNQVAGRERGGASALNLLAAFSAPALAAWGAGALLARFGYGAVLAGVAGLALAAAGLFQILLGRRGGSVEFLTEAARN
jgi:predicted MFS family arabinose efflux permease